MLKIAIDGNKKMIFKDKKLIKFFNNEKFQKSFINEGDLHLCRPSYFNQRKDERKDELEGKLIKNKTHPLYKIKIGEKEIGPFLYGSKFTLTKRYEIEKDFFIFSMYLYFKKQKELKDEILKKFGNFICVILNEYNFIDQIEKSCINKTCEGKKNNFLWVWKSYI